MWKITKIGNFCHTDPFVDFVIVVVVVYTSIHSCSRTWKSVYSMGFNLRWIVEFLELRFNFDKLNGILVYFDFMILIPHKNFVKGNLEVNKLCCTKLLKRPQLGIPTIGIFLNSFLFSDHFLRQLQTGWNIFHAYSFEDYFIFHLKSGCCSNLEADTRYCVEL